MKKYIEYFQIRSPEITRRLKTLQTPVRFIPVLTDSTKRFGFGILECGNAIELKKVYKNLNDLVTEELEEEAFAKYVIANYKDAPPSEIDQITGEDFSIFEVRSLADMLESLGLDKYIHGTEEDHKSAA